MKNNHFFHFIAVLCLFLSMTSCDKADSNALKNDVQNSDKVTLRDACDDCSDFNDECCCVVEYISGMGGTVHLCGTADGVDACTGSATGGCSSFSGGGHTFLLSMGMPSFTFCMDKNAPFYFANDSDNPLTVRISCQVAETEAQYETIIFTGNGREYLETNGDCEVDGC